MATHQAWRGLVDGNEGRLGGNHKHKNLCNIVEMARRSSRKSTRKSSRHGRRASRKHGRRASRKHGRRCWSGGAAPVNNASMTPMSQQALAQGGNYLALHKGQHGGAAVSLAAAAPVGYTGMLDDSLRGVARVAPLDHSMGAIQGMRDQSGGARRRKGRRGAVATARRMTKRARQSLMKALRRVRKFSRKMRGGAALHPADYGSPGMLLGAADQAKALMGMNPEWKLASDPGAFAPRA